MADSLGKIEWAFNGATVMNSPWAEELKLWEQFGWRKVELWQTKIDAELERGATLGELATQLRNAGVTPVGLCAGVVLTDNTGHDLQEEIDNLLVRLDTAAELTIPSLTIIMGADNVVDLAEEYRALAPKCRRFAEMATERGIRLNLEFLGSNPIMGTLGSCIELVNAVDHPNFGALFDLCHYYVSASHIEELALLPIEKLFMVHVNGVRPGPMEMAKNDGRCFPDEGRMDVAGLLDILRRTDYRGLYSIELYDEEIWKLDPQFVMQRLADSLRAVERELDRRAEPSSPSRDDVSSAFGWRGHRNGSAEPEPALR